MWIRVEAHEVDSVRVARMAEALRIKPVQALGHLVALAGQVAEHTPSGHIADIPDSALEKWAAWTSKGGQFAAAARQHLQDPETGDLGNWRETMGKLIDLREKEAERMRLRRAAEAAIRTTPQRASAPTVRERLGNGSHTLREQSTATERYGTRRNASPCSGISADSVSESPELAETEEIFLRTYYSEASTSRIADVQAQIRATLSGNGARISGSQFARAANLAHLRRCMAAVISGERPKDPDIAVVWVLREIVRTRLEFMSEQARTSSPERTGNGGPASVAKALQALAGSDD